MRDVRDTTSCVILAGGALDERFASAFLRGQPGAFLIAADKGLAFCARHALVPDLVVGDFDGLGEAALAEALDALRHLPGGEETELLRFPAQKDETDMGIAADEALRRGVRKLRMLGGTGARLDHTLANVGLLYRMKQAGVRAELIDANNRIYLAMERRFFVQRRDAAFVSFFPYAGEVRGLTLRGFRYELSGHTLAAGQESFTTSNEIVAERAEVCFSSGELLVVESRDASD